MGANQRRILAMEISINKKEEEEGEEMLYYVHDGLEKQICAFVWG